MKILTPEPDELLELVSDLITVDDYGRVLGGAWGGKRQLYVKAENPFSFPEFRDLCEVEFQQNFGDDKYQQCYDFKVFENGRESIECVGVLNDLGKKAAAWLERGYCVSLEDGEPIQSATIDYWKRKLRGGRAVLSRNLWGVLPENHVLVDNGEVWAYRIQRAYELRKTGLYCIGDNANIDWRQTRRRYEDLDYASLLRHYASALKRRDKRLHRAIEDGMAKQISETDTGGLFVMLSHCRNNFPDANFTKACERVLRKKVLGDTDLGHMMKYLTVQEERDDAMVGGAMMAMARASHRTLARIHADLMTLDKELYKDLRMEFTERYIMAVPA